MAFDRLIEKIAEMQNPTVAGLDPKLDYTHAAIGVMTISNSFRWIDS